MEFIVPGELDGISVKNFLRKHCNISARLLAKLKRTENGMIVGGSPVRSTDILRCGDCIVLNLPEEQSFIEPEKLDVEIVYEDDQIIIFNKPPGMLVHPVGAYRTGTLANFAQFHAEQRGEKNAFHPVSRLDKDTSGLVLAAKNRYSAGFLSGRTQKLYTALCEGVITESGTIDLSLRIMEGHSIQRETGEGGVYAVTHYEPVESFGYRYTLLRVWIETGRTHQIRAHFAAIGHPLAGDDMYGGKRDEFPRQCLHCRSIELIHPITGEKMSFQRDIDFFAERVIS